MLVNSILLMFQNLLKLVYDRSFVLQKIDWLIFANILFVILSSTFAQSDTIGYFAIFAIILTIVKLLTKSGAKFEMNTADKFLLVYFLFVVISVAGSTLFSLSLKGFCKTLIYLGFYISFIHYIKDNRSKIKYILIALAFAALGESIIALKQNFLSVSEISGWQDMSRLNPEEVMTRVYGTLKPYNPNLFGGYMLAALPSTLIIIYLPLLNRHYKTALFGLGCFFLSAVSIVLTGCRGAYVGLFVEFILMALIAYNFLQTQFKKLFLTISGILSSLIFMFVISKASLRARIFSIFAMRRDSSNSFRFNVYNSCVDMFKDNWALGIGVGNQNFREIYGLYMKTGFDALSAYNIYLETAVESGVFALVAFLAFIGVNIAKSVKYIFRTSPHPNPPLRRGNVYKIYVSIALISLTGILIHGFVDTVFFRPQIQFIFWIMVGIIRVLTYAKKN